jgi:hypothetical protein
MRLLKIIGFSFLVLFSISCSNENQIQLPPATEEGKDILGCFVNGNVFIAQGGFIGGVEDLGMSISEESFNLAGTAYGDDTNVDGNLYIYVINQDVRNKIDQEITLNNKSTEVGYFIDSSGKEYYTGADKFTGKLKISKLDTIKEIVSGTFWFDAVSNDGDIVEIRDGRFDILFTCCFN